MEPQSPSNDRKRRGEEGAPARAPRLLPLGAIDLVGVALVETDGQLLDANDALLTLLGYTRAELEAGMIGWNELTDQKAEKAMASTRTYGPVEKELVRKDGSRVAVLVRSAAMPEDSRLAVLSVVDLTKQNATEQALRVSEERLRLLVEGVEDHAIFLLDSRGFVMTWSGGAERIKGYTAEEIIGEHVSRFYTAEDMAKGKPERELQAAAAAGKVEDEGWRVRKDGRRFWAHVIITALYDDDGVLRGYSKITKDITERRRSEQLLRSVVDNTLDGIISIDQRGTVQWFNLAAERIFGYAASEVIGQNVKMLMPEPYHGEHDGYLANYMATGNAKVIGIGREVVGRRKDGSTFPMDLAVSEFHLGHRRYFTGIVRDISDRKRAEARLHETAEELLRSNLDLEQFAYVAYHDLQEPLRAVAGCVQILQRRYADQLGGRADELIAHTVDGVRRMQRLIDDLLAYSRIGTRGKAVEPTDLNAVLEQALANLQVAVEESGAVVTHDVLPVVRADAAQLTQLFQNLVGNAVKFRGSETPRIHVGVRRTAAEWVLAVKDNGIGVEPEYFERIFVIFQRLHTGAEYPGTGIGLAVCKKIVERHGGRIWLESEPGKGTTFFFTSPIGEEVSDETRRQANSR